MKIENIKPGEVYAIPGARLLNGTYDYPTLTQVRDNEKCLPGLVLDVGKYRKTYMPCGRGVVVSTDPFTAKSVLLIAPVPYRRLDSPREGDRSFNRWREPWTWDTPTLDWDYDLALLPPSQVYPLIQWCEEHEELMALKDERHAIEERMTALRLDLVPILAEDAQELMRRGDLGIVWDGPREEKVWSITSTVKVWDTKTDYKFPPAAQAILDELKALAERLACVR